MILEHTPFNVAEKVALKVLAVFDLSILTYVSKIVAEQNRGTEPEHRFSYSFSFFAAAGEKPHFIRVTLHDSLYSGRANYLKGDKVVFSGKFFISGGDVKWEE